MFIFYELFLMFSFAFFRWIKFCSCCFRQVFFHLGVKKVVAGRVKRSCFDGNLFGQTQHWSFYRGGCLNRSHCNALS